MCNVFWCKFFRLLHPTKVYQNNFIKSDAEPIIDVNIVLKWWRLFGVSIKYWMLYLILYWTHWILNWKVTCSSVSPSNIGIVFGSGLPIPMNTGNISNILIFANSNEHCEYFKILPIPINTVNVSKYCQFRLTLWIFQIF